ncbi:hypothetical protein VK94_06575 [Bacillus sp. LK7]|nr:hypothetical protein VK94_06575 [Bacillus sp. LK7]
MNMSLESDVYKKMIKEMEDQNSQLAEEYEALDKELNENVIKLNAIEKLEFFTRNLNLEEGFYKKHFKLEELTKKVEDLKQQKNEFLQVYRQKSQLNLLAIDALKETLDNE